MTEILKNSEKRELFELTEEIFQKLKVTKAEALTAAIAFKRNIIEIDKRKAFEAAFAVDYEHVTAMEAIALQLGFIPNEEQKDRITIINAINNIKK